jgi:hypothetical protein
VWDYLKECRQENKDSNYRGFLVHLEKEANQYKLEYQTGKMNHEVKKDERITDMAKKYGTSEKKIKKINNLKSSTLKPGMQLSVFVADKKIRERILKKRKKTLSENLNYPPKFNAVMELIEEGIG